MGKLTKAAIDRNPRILMPGASIKIDTDQKIKNIRAAVKAVHAAIGSQPQEYVVTVTIDVNLHPIEMRIVAIGNSYRASVSARDILRGAIIDDAYGVIVAHNHPQSSLKTSKDDRRFIRTLKKAGKLLDIVLYDSIIMNAKEWVSMEV